MHGVVATLTTPAVDPPTRSEGVEVQSNQGSVMCQGVLASSKTIIYLKHKKNLIFR